jgi:hypothetical protein
MASTNGSQLMTRYYQPDLSTDLDSPFVRDGEDRLIRRSYWLDMDDRTLVMVMVKGVGSNLTNDEKRAHLIDLRREHLIDQVCPQEILPPERYGLCRAVVSCVTPHGLSSKAIFPNCCLTATD